MSDLLTPAEWCELRGIYILDPDGWRGKHGRDWSDPIDEAEFKRRAVQCTVRYDADAREYFEVSH